MSETTKNRKLIYIEWHDAVANTGWLNKERMEEFANSDPAIIREIGWVYREDDKEIVLFGRTDITEDEYGLIQKIPKTWIRKRIEISQEGFYE